MGFQKIQLKFCTQPTLSLYNASLLVGAWAFHLHTYTTGINILYDGVLRLPIPGGMQIIGYADDIAVIIVAKELHQTEALCMTTLAKIKSWLSSAYLQLVAQTTEAILIMSMKKIEYVTRNIDGHNITFQLALRYLGNRPF